MMKFPSILADARSRAFFAAAAASAVLAASQPAPAQPSPTPSAHATPATARQSGFGTRIHRPANFTSTVSSAACNRRAAGVGTAGNTMGPNGATASNTLVAVPIGGGDPKSATQQQQITEACNHHRH
jgi:hypothetical protein